LVFVVPEIRAISYPSAKGFVNDFADLYSNDFEAKLTSKLSEFEKNTKGEIAVLTIKNLEGEPIEDYAVKIFEKWKIGKEKDDNGILLLISKDDREVRIEVGYGFEQYINDARAGDIIRNDIVPEFRNLDYEKGTEKATDSLIAYIGNKDVAPAAKLSDKESIPFWVIVMGIYFIGTYLGSFLGRTKAIWPGGVIGAIIGLVIGAIISTYVVGIIIAIFGGLFGLFLDFILSKNYQVRKAKGLPTTFWGSGGGFSGGSGRSSFSGFGGGSSGGGGASGRW